MPKYARFYFSSRTSQYMIETSEVQDLIAKGDPNVRFINASWYLPAWGLPGDAKAEHEEHRLTKETQFFPISEVAKVDSGLPNTMPDAQVFSEHMRALRIGKDHQIVCYDHIGMFSVARCAWMLRYFGAGSVRIMNGGLQKYLKEGRPVYSGPYSVGEGLPESGDYNYAPVDTSALITDVAPVHELAGKIVSGDSSWQITDARPAARFNGEMPEPPNVRAGHISGSKNVPFSDLVDKETGCLKSEDELKQVFAGKGIDLDKQTVHSCNSGVTACIVELAYSISGGSKSAIYDGSWSQYGRHDEPDFSKKV